MQGTRQSKALLMYEREFLHEKKQRRFKLVGYVNDRGTLRPLGNYHCMELSGPWYPVWRDLNGPAMTPDKVEERRI